MKKVLSDMYFLGRKCIFCDKYGLYKLEDRRVKYKHCKIKYSISQLKRNHRDIIFLLLRNISKKNCKRIPFK